MIENPPSSGFTRRLFLRNALISFAVLFLGPIDHVYSSVRKIKTHPAVSAKLLKHKFRSFTPYQAAVIEEITSLIIPTDEYPGAREAEVVFEIDHIIAGIKIQKGLIIKGVELLDKTALNKYGKNSFLDLNFDQKTQIMQEAGSVTVPPFNRTAPARLSTEQIVRLFFELTKKTTFEVFYSSKTGWDVVGYKGPPQWSGNRDYHKCL